MAQERSWNAVQPQLFTADGNAFGVITLVSTNGFKTKQSAYLISNTNPAPLPVQIKRVLSCTQLVVGTINNAQMGSWKPLDISSYTVASGAKIGAESQPKAILKPDDIEVFTYEQEPVVARRVIFVDECGNFYDDNNPLPVAFDGTISVGQVEIKGPSGDILNVNPDGSINVVVEASSASSTVVSTFGEALSVASNSTVTIVTYTVPLGKKAVLQKAPVSGDNIGRYQLVINNVIQDKIRTMFGADLSQIFDFTSGNDSGLVLNAGDVVQIKVFNPRPYVADFNARIQVAEFT